MSVLTASQCQILEEAFQMKPYQSKEDYTRLAAETGATRSQLCDWFYMRRRVSGQTMRKPPSIARSHYNNSRNEILLAAAKNHGLFPDSSVCTKLANQLRKSRNYVQKWFRNERSKLRLNRKEIDHVFTDDQSRVLKHWLNNIGKKPSETLIEMLAKQLQLSKYKVSQWFAKYNVARKSTEEEKIDHSSDSDFDLDDRLSDDDNHRDSDQLAYSESWSKWEKDEERFVSEDEVEPLVASLVDDIEKKFCLSHLEVEKQMEEMRHEMSELRQQILSLPMFHQS